MKREAVFWCIVLFVSQFGPVISFRLENQKHRGLSVKSEKAPAKRWGGAAKTLLHFAFKAIKVTGDYFNKITSLLSIVSTVYTLIEDCEDTQYGQEAKRINDQIDNITKTINDGKSTIYDIQLETKELQVKVETLNYIFNNTLEEMDQAGYLSERFLSIVSPDIDDALNVTTLELEKQLNEAETAGTTVDYAALTKTYYGRMDKMVTLSVPIFENLLPKLPKMVKFAKARMGNFKGWKLTNKFNNIKIPGKNTAAYKGMKSWFSKTSDFIKTAKDAVRNVVTTKYSKALNVVKKLKDAIGVMSSYVFGAFNIYTIVQNFGRADCKKLVDKAKETYTEIVKAQETYNGIMANVTAAKEEMNKVKDDMLEQVTSDVFLNDLTAMKENMKQIQGDGNGMQDMIDATDRFLETVQQNKQDITAVLDAMTDLYEVAMGSLPFIYNCLIERGGLVGQVVRQCEKGKDTLNNIITTERTLKNYEPELCKQRTGISYFSEDELNQHTISTASTQNFKTECKLNNQDTLDWMCDLKCQGDKPETIARKVGVSDQTQVDEVLNNCDECQITSNQEGLICFMIASNKDKTIEDLQREFFPQYTVEQLKNVKCPPQTT